MRPLNMSQPSRSRLIITLQLLPLGPVARRTSRTIAGTSFNASHRPRGLSLSFRARSRSLVKYELFLRSPATCKNSHPNDRSRKWTNSKKLLPEGQAEPLETRSVASGNEKNLN